MSDSEEWGPWVEHDGQRVPEAIFGNYIGVVSRFDDGREEYQEGTLPPKSHPGWCRVKYCWLGGDIFAAPVIRYRIRKPRALRQLIEMVENLPAPSHAPGNVEHDT